MFRKCILKVSGTLGFCTQLAAMPRHLVLAAHGAETAVAFCVSWSIAFVATPLKLIVTHASVAKIAEMPIEVAGGAGARAARGVSAANASPFRLHAALATKDEPPFVLGRAFVSGVVLAIACFGV
mmetsp:Transcript_10431/g.32346  ORF Transcript_10431/g.32346 Transcript_10431/m.32346 type:complete len:125 (-) Transcript_10431:1941-2315(-)